LPVPSRHDAAIGLGYGKFERSNMLADVSDIIVVDDDAALRQMVIGYLEEHSVPSRAASSRAELHRHLERTQPSLIILDLRLGLDDGLDMLREIRAHSDVPVIITTGHRLDETDRIVGLELGADDYIIKPFSLRELLARVRAVLRRQEMGRAARARDPERGGYCFNGWKLERRGRRLIDVNNTQLPLSKGEYNLLLAFLEAPQRPLTREHLLQATRVHEDIFDRSIDVQVLRLRRKLETDPSAPRIIQTERGVGYVFTIPVEPF
jgi:two-component system OmpR family response regulator